MKTTFHSCANLTRVHMNGCAPGLALLKRVRANGLLHNCGVCYKQFQASTGFEEKFENLAVFNRVVGVLRR